MGKSSHKMYRKTNTLPKNLENDWIGFQLLYFISHHQPIRILFFLVWSSWFDAALSQKLESQ